MSITESRFLHTMIRVMDLEKSLKFYSEQLGKEIGLYKDPVSQSGSAGGAQPRSSASGSSAARLSDLGQGSTPREPFSWM